MSGSVRFYYEKLVLSNFYKFIDPKNFNIYTFNQYSEI